MFEYPKHNYLNDIGTTYTVSYRLPNGCKGSMEILELNKKEAKQVAINTLPKKTVITNTVQKGCFK